MHSLLRIVRTVPLRLGMTAALALTAPALGAAGDEPPDQPETSTATSTTTAPSGSVTDFLSFDAEPEVAAPSGDGTALAAVPAASSASANEASAGDQK